MAKIDETHNLVLEVLQDQPESRGDDFLLILAVLNKFVDSNDSIEAILKLHKELCLPSFETITRCRRKIQAEHPELSGDGIRKIRKDQEKIFKQYALKFE